eukprot:Plantae.Rhodophyta-Rhodochaete_pulchella.ctg24654.p3 GENE.Plantae.Rhodophyta-Rhodochaete_pulchella.ctg24654~~Plantae.Rhodophyta-Rhodochaete_pulchella.ctg24654.p3  ORF type:complete len:113 (-),score=8.44 Plantae.Rhodophyta-Rhodochaete_pulchella.ctg24654:80-385(-)
MATFYSACPRNNLMTESTFLTVEQQAADGTWQVVANDGHWETRFHWYRHSTISSQSFADISWEVPAGTAAGTYRIGHQGYYKHFLGHNVAFSGYTSSFKIG